MRESAFGGEANVIAVVGLAGSGKSTAVDVLVEATGAPVVYFGGLVIAEVKARGLSVNEKNEKMVREELRSESGMAAIAELAVPRLKSLLEQGHSLVIVDGLYSGAELSKLRDLLPGSLRTMAVHARRHVREDRMRSRKIRPLTPDELWSRDLGEVEALDKATPIALADMHIVNDDDMERLRRGVLRLMSEEGLITAAARRLAVRSLPSTVGGPEL